MENSKIKWEIEEAEEEFQGLQARRTTQLPNKQNLNYVEEEDEDEINGGLSAVKNEDSDYKQKNVDINGEVDEYSSEELRSSDNGEIEASEAEIIEEVDPKSSEKCVYNQTDKGIESTNGIFSNGHSSIEHTIAEKIHNNNQSEVTIMSLDIKDCLSEESKIEQEKQVKHSSLSGPNLLPSEISPEENDKSFDFYSDNPIESSDTNTLYVRDHETMELDVERVLRKQETHDLYCPNCNSCITKRVIIRKRKRRLPNLGEDGKRNKIENITGSGLIPTSVATTSNPSHSTIDTCLDGNGAPASDKFDRDQEPDVFRCLSCFSIFVPTGNGFKLFRMFGDRSDKDNLEDPPQTPVPKKSWFSTLFQSEKRDTVRADVETVEDEGLISSNSMRQNGKVSLTHESSSNPRLDLDGEPVKTEIKESARGANNRSSPQEVGLAVPGSLDIIKDQITNNLNKQNGEASLNQAPSHADGEIIPNELTGSKEGSDKVLSLSKEYDTHLVGRGKILDSSTEDITLKQSDATSKILESLNFPKEVPLNEAEHSEISLAGSPPTTAREAAEVSTFIPQENGLKFFLPSGVSSFTVETTKTDQQVNVMIPDKTSVGDMIVIAENGHVQSSAAQRLNDVIKPAETGNLQHLETRVVINEQSAMPTRGIQGPEIIKSIVYGGLVESITSLGVVSSAAGSDATTLHVLALGLANLIGGLIIIGHNVWELKNDKKTEDSEQSVERVDRYHELLGNRRNFLLHAAFAILSFLTFGLIPPVIYGFSFCESDDRNLKLATVAAASLIGIMILSAGKAYVRNEPKSYLKTVSYYIMMGLMVTGVSYAAGNLINMFLQKLGVFQSGLTITLPEIESMKPSWSSY